MSDCGHGSPLSLLLGQELIGPEWIVAHMNELDESDFALLEKTPLHIVHCPASHRYFGHQAVPYRTPPLDWHQHLPRHR